MFICYCTDIGKVRGINQDAIHYIDNDKLPIYILADGMGGHKQGEVASNTAINTTVRLYEEKLEEIIKGSMEIPEFLNLIFDEVNSKIIEQSKLIYSEKDIGTTLTICLIRDKELFVGHVGDSRAYIIRGNELIQITHDHSFVGDLLKSGVITEEEAFSHPKKNLITKSLGLDESVNPDIYSSPLEEEDLILLTSDGLTSYVKTQRIKDIIFKSNEKKEICKRLVDEANSVGGPDNISVLIANIK